jgi:hypothetical protein
MRLTTQLSPMHEHSQTDLVCFQADMTTFVNIGWRAFFMILAYALTYRSHELPRLSDPPYPLFTSLLQRTRTLSTSYSL